MPLKVNLILQIALIVLNAGQALLPLLSPQTKMLIGVGLACGNSIVGTVAHFYNTDGTSQAVPFVPPVNAAK